VSRCDPNPDSRKRYKTKREASVQPRRFPVADHRASSRKDEVLSCFMVTSGISRATVATFAYRFRKQDFPPRFRPSFLSLVSFRWKILVSLPSPTAFLLASWSGDRIDAIQHRRSQRLDREPWAARKLLLLRCNNANSYTYSRVH